MTHYDDMFDAPERALQALEQGKAAEHLVCADLILQGYRVFLSDQGLPYDILVDIEGKFVRIQVKSTLKAKDVNHKGATPSIAYAFAVRRRGKGGRGEPLSRAHCDVLALVALDIKAIAYLPVEETAQTLFLYPPGYKFPGKYRRNRRVSIDALPFAEVVK